MNTIRPPVIAIALALMICDGIHPASAARAEPNSVGPWPTYNGGYDGRRFSPSRQITPANVSSLKRVCEAQLGDPGSFHSGIVVIGDMLYVTTPHTTVALDARDCTVRWQNVYKPEQDEVYSVNRGVAYLDGRIFRGTADGRVFALDAKTGERLWIVKAGDPQLGEFFSSAPIAWRGLVFIGAAGGDWGIRGYVIALDASTGRERWRFHTIPMGTEPGADSWPSPETASRGGGAMWTTYTLDDKAGELFVPVGNPAPDYAPDTRLGANLYSDSFIVLDALTGKLKWYHQFKENDGTDYDLGAAPVLYSGRNGAKLVVAGSKDGYVYGFDRATHQQLFKTPVTTIRNSTARPTPAGVVACPGPLGGVEWNGPAIDPKTRAVYVGAVDWCFTFVSGTPEYKPGQLYFGTNQKPGGPGVPDPSGWVTKVDGLTGATLWRYHADAPVVAGVTPTAGGIVLTGDLNGDLFALDSSSGKLLYKYNTGGGIAGGVVTYEVDGTQYVATTSGNVSRMTFSGTTGVPKIVILTTGLSTDEPKLVTVGGGAASMESEAGLDDVGRGKALFKQYCSACHGAGGEGGAGAVLKGEATRKDHDAVVAFIKNPLAPMPKMYPAPLSDEDAVNLATFVETLK